MSLKNSKLFGKIISSSQTGYPIAKSLVSSQKKLIFHTGYDIDIYIDIYFTMTIQHSKLIQTNYKSI